MHVWGLKPAVHFALAVGGSGVPWAAASPLLELHTAPGGELSIPPQGYPIAACITQRLASSGHRAQNQSQMWKTEQLKQHVSAPWGFCC